MNVDVESKVLLDKLYNLRSDDSILLAKMDDERDIALQTKNRTLDEKSIITNKIKELSDEEILLASEGELLKDALKNINRDAFTLVFNKLNIDFDPRKLSERVDSVLPSTIDCIKKEILVSNENLDNVVKEMDDAITKIDELAIRRDEAVCNQSKLNEYFGLALDGNINITRDALTALLSKFDLTLEEQRESAKLLMFPEDGLYEYEERFSKKSGKTFSDVFRDAKIATESDSVVKPISLSPSKPVVSEPVKSQEVVKPISLSIEKPVKNDDVVKPISLGGKLSTSSNSVESNVKPISMSGFNPAPKVNADALFASNGFKITDFSASDVKKIEENLDENIFLKNIKVINDLGLNKDIFNDNVDLFFDKELDEKLKTLLGVGKVPFDIYLNPVVLVKYDMNTLQKSIDSLRSSGLDPKKVPLMAF